MSDISGRAVAGLTENGFKAGTVSCKHLPELEENIENLKRQGLVDTLLAKTYLQFKYDSDSAMPDTRTVFIIAIPQPLTRTRFTWKGHIYNADIPPTYIGSKDDAAVSNILTSIIQAEGFKSVRTNLPVKILAVRSGLAEYGRNNLAYIHGFGSYHRLIAFVSDCPCTQDNWNEPKEMKACSKCFKCTRNCPSGCISDERFLLKAENCLTWHNEREDTLAGWIDPDWHNALIGCMRCQTVCPLNTRQSARVIPGPEFTEEETNLIRQKLPANQIPADLYQKLSTIAMDDSYPVFARNLELLVNPKNIIR
ncbi:hypothetical protein ASJ33_00030 [Dehalococcoides mccartyi]|jgi:epoxyqueuosine reductase|uniref:4Fe-4S double cluster binding domain-containing protein n=1 Tax=Dehalococcoides mccartyi TaxID=61435 RepID=UPI0004E09B19|nr:4Fe-4S double cluster binding domain-containing protein [Dehalococcoides mccartyi]AII58534.1 FeS-binding protein [Dehalococcoides mccartyi CG1]APH11655.1 hypothetical protein ASJ33_00030 [Dehalococcoides mccartyi]